MNPTERATDGDPGEEGLDTLDAPVRHDERDAHDPPPVTGTREGSTSSPPSSPQNADGHDGAELQDAIARIWARSRDTVLARVATIERAARLMLDGRLDEAPRADAAHEAHRLAGSLGTFGFAQGSAMARELEHLLTAAGEPSSADVLRVCELVDRLRTELQRPARHAVAADDARSATGTVLMVSHDDALVGRLRHRLDAWGLDLLRTTAAPAAATQQDAALIVLDLGPGGDAAAHAALLRGMPAGAGQAPLVVLTASAEEATRIEAARAGARRIISRGAAPELIVDAMRSVLPAPPERTIDVLLAGDPTRPQVRSAFDDPRLEVTATTDPLIFLRALTHEAPALVVIDADHPAIDAALFGHLVRMDPRWDALPMVFLAPPATADLSELADRLRTDAIMTTPLPPRSADRLLVEVDRARGRLGGNAAAALAGGAETGALETLLARARSNDRRVIVVRVLWRPDPMAPPAPDAGSAAAAALAKRLRASLGAGDRLIRDDDGLVLALYDTTPEAAATWIQTALRSAAATEAPSPGLVPRAGIATFPEDGARPVDLLAAAAARAPRFDAEAAVGRPTATPASGDGRDTDVLLIDDDETLGALLTHALGARGYRVQWLADGIDAANKLLGPDPKLRPRLILLDVNLPSLDGLSLLRRFRDSGYLDRTKVIMLTARVREAEVVEALSLGAHDHVGKPFSVPVLAERIRRVLGA